MEQGYPLFANRVALGIDVRNPERELDTLPETIRIMRGHGVNTELVFIEATDDVLTRRFSETRRKHPLSSATINLIEALHKERALLEPLSEFADLRIDTTHTQLHELRDIVRERIARREPNSMSIQFISFGYKHGLPRDADFVFDSRCLPNPHWNQELRPHTGRDEPVIRFMESQPHTKALFEQIRSFLENWIPQFEADNRSYLTVAVGCTGGQHRSVYLIECLSRFFVEQGKLTLVRHRDI
ncbi:MAG: RNase adapter RapZ [Gammaproteobacteria bacterium]|nr:RNase adapter RapZ [Gammaproteobacteria bacterium]